MSTAVLEYREPSIVLSGTDEEFVENDLPVFVAAAGWVLLVFGGAWAYCKAVCGWSNVKSCSTSWLKVTAVCKE